MSFKFYETLFPNTDAICMGRSKYDTKITGASIDPQYQFFSINALRESRRDANVTSYRNILLEFDGGSIPTQMASIIDSGVPYTSIVFSGGKSLHCIISLEIPVENEFEYRSLVERIYKRIPGIDKSCGNPSRFSRAPGGNREGVYQELLVLRDRVRNALLDAWLGPKPAPEEPKAYTHTGHMSGFTKNFILFGAPAGEWNISLFRAVCDMTRCGMPLETIRSRCESITGYLDHRDLSTIRSAYTRAAKDVK